MRARVFTCVRAYARQCVQCDPSERTEAASRQRLGIVISPRYEFYFLVCFSRLTISLSASGSRATLRQLQNQRKRSVIMSDALIERVGISGNRARVDSLSSLLLVEKRTAEDHV